MNMYQPTQRTFEQKVSNIKREAYYSPQKLNIYYPPKPDVRAFIKSVEVTCMNRLYQGVGFRNNNGGLEFFSEEYKEKHCDTVSKTLDVLREEQKILEEEYENIQFEIARGNGSINEWQSHYDELESQLQEASISMQHLILQGRSGQIAENEKIRIRQQLKNEEKRVKAQMKSVKTEIDNFHNNKTRLAQLKCILPELQAKIADKEAELPIVSTFTIKQPGLLTFPWVQGIVAKQVNLFADMFDYIAYVFLANNSAAEKLPTVCDNIILNDPRNFTDMMLNSVGYDRIYCFFPHTLSGDTMEKTFLERIDTRRVISLRDYYKDYPTLYEFAKTFNDFVPVTSKD